MSLDEITPTKKKCDTSTPSAQPSLSTTNINADQVSAFLQTEPDFFVGREHLLPNLVIPHGSKDTISLIEKQVEVLRNKNETLQEHYANLLENAQLNSELFNKTRKLSIALLKATSNHELQSTLVNTMKNEFDIDAVSILVFKSCLKISDFGDRYVDPNEAKKQLPNWTSALNTQCGSFRPNENKILFDQEAENIQSAAIIPLSTPKTMNEDKDELLGLLALGSKDTKKFSAQMGTVFVDYIGEIASIALARFNNDSMKTQ